MPNQSFWYAFDYLMRYYVPWWVIFFGFFMLAIALAHTFMKHHTHDE